MRTPWILALIGLAMTGGGALAAADSTPLILDSKNTDDGPTARVLVAESGQLRVEYRLPWLDVAQVDIDGQRYQALSIPDGGLAGEEGQPGLPTFSKLLAIPPGKGVSVRVVTSDEQRFTGYRVLPVDGGDTGMQADAGTVNDDRDQPAATVVSVGAPALVRGLRVVPVTIHPVSYDAARGEISVLSNVTVEFTFTGEDRRNDPAGAVRPVPESFARLLADRVVNYPDSDTGATGTPSTYLAICPNSAGVVDALGPLLDWRRRQGYNVILATTGETGTTTASIKSYIRSVYLNTDIPPLEFVVLVGDANGTVSIPCWYENVSYFHGEGDHYYTTLEGDDVLSDILIGRLTCRNTTELQTIVAKIVGYETAPPVDDPNWFGRAALVGDPSDSGITTIFVNEWLKAQLENHGYTEIETIFGGNYASLMVSISV